MRSFVGMKISDTNDGGCLVIWSVANNRIANIYSFNEAKWEATKMEVEKHHS